MEDRDAELNKQPPKRERKKSQLAPETQKILKSKVRAEKAQKHSLDWFYKAIKSSSKRIPDRSIEYRRRPVIGGLFHYFYSPKYATTLPYYDKFPLTIPIEMYDNGFLGLNLHYLPPMYRASMMDLLINEYMRTKSTAHYMKISYKILHQASLIPLFEPCIHRYLYSHLASAPVSISPEYWGEIIMLPTQQFVKATAKEVWSNSRALHRQHRSRKK